MTNRTRDIFTWFLVIVSLALVLLAVFGTGAALPQQRALCGPRDSLLKVLEKQYGETPVAVGTLGTTMVAVAELLLSSEGSWTLIRSTPDGMSCILAGGKNWETTGEPKKPGKDT